MFIICWSSIAIGFVIGFCLGTALALWASWSTDKEMYKSFGSDWSRGYDKGYESGVNAQKIEEALHRPIKQKGRFGTACNSDDCIQGKTEKLNFDIVRCVTGDENFREGELYASIGWNNGIGVQYEDNHGNCITQVFCSGGTGKGFINNYDDSGKPSFDPVDCKIVQVTDK